MLNISTHPRISLRGEHWGPIFRWVIWLLQSDIKWVRVLFPPRGSPGTIAASQSPSALCTHTVLCAGRMRLQLMPASLTDSSPGRLPPRAHLSSLTSSRKQSIFISIQLLNHQALCPLNGKNTSSLCSSITCEADSHPPKAPPKACWRWINTTHQYTKAEHLIGNLVSQADNSKGGCRYKLFPTW